MNTATATTTATTTKPLTYDYLKHEKKLTIKRPSESEIYTRALKELTEDRAYVSSQEKANIVQAINELMEYSSSISLNSTKAIKEYLEKKTQNHELPKHVYKIYGQVYDALTSKGVELKDGVYDALTGHRINREIDGYIVAAVPLEANELDRATFAKLLALTQNSATSYEYAATGRTLGNIVKIVVKDGKPFAAVTVKTFTNALRLMIENNIPSMYDAREETSINNPYYTKPAK